jgi:hypothetical protein
MLLVAWCALSAAPAVALSPPLVSAFLVLALGLVAATTLRFSERAGMVVAVLTTWRVLGPALLAAVALVGAAVLGELASAGLEWDLVLRSAARAATTSPHTMEEPDS